MYQLVLPPAVVDVVAPLAVPQVVGDGRLQGRPGCAGPYDAPNANAADEEGEDLPALGRLARHGVWARPPRR